MRTMKYAILSVFALLVCASPAWAQASCPTIANGAVLTAAQWNGCFSAKQDVLTYTPVNKAGDTMTGRLATAAATSARSGFAIFPGSAPTNPVDGDMWVTTSGLYVRINGVTIGPLASSATVSVAVGSTIISGGTPKGLIYNNAGTVGNLASANNGVLVTDGSGTPSISSSLPSGLSATGANLTGANLLGTPTIPGLSSGVCANGLALDGSNNLIKIICPSAATDVQIGATGVLSGTDGYLVYNNSGTLGNRTIASALTAGAGVSISGSTNATIAQSLSNATLTGTPTNPASTTSTTNVMAGIGVSTCRITPTYSGRIKFEVSGSIGNSGAGNSMRVQAAYGTGAGPANGSAATGTTIGAQGGYSVTSSVAVLPFYVGGIATGLTPGVAYWFDVGFSGGAGTTTVSSITCTAMEF